MEVHSHNFPYVSFMGQTLANHSYVDLNEVGYRSYYYGNSDSVVCHSDLVTCCSAGQGLHRGDWYFPNGSRLSFYSYDISESRRAQRVYLIKGRRSHTSLSGIYRCDIATVAVHGGDGYNSLDRFVRDTAFVGLYPTGEGMYIK